MGIVDIVGIVLRCSYLYLGKWDKKLDGFVQVDLLLRFGLCKLFDWLHWMAFFLNLFYLGPLL